MRHTHLWILALALALAAGGCPTTGIIGDDDDDDDSADDDDDDTGDDDTGDDDDDTTPLDPPEWRAKARILVVFG